MIDPDTKFTIIPRTDLPELYADIPVPPIDKLQGAKVGMDVRIAVRAEGDAGRRYVTDPHLFPWVRIVEVEAPGNYVGEVGGIWNSPDWLPYGTRVHFGAVSIVATDWLP